MHRFAKEVLRPVGRELDKLTAEQVVAPGSPLWTVFGEFSKLGFDPALLAQLPPDVAIRIESLVGEELGWGDSGLGVSLAVADFPRQMALAAQKPELVELCAGKIGCWMITHPDKGSDTHVFDMRRDWPENRPGNKGNLWGTISGDEIVIKGQCSAWVSNGAIAQVALGYIGADYGDGFYDAEGLPRGMTVMIPLDRPGVSRGRPLEKIGQRALPQGEIYFDNVRIPKRFALALRDEYYGNLASAWSYAGTHMSQLFTGVARAAFELALQYCHERRQGGRLLIDHQLTRFRLGDMLRRVEAARAVARRSLTYARLSPNTHPYVTAAAKVTVTEEAMKVVTEAFQLLGGAGISREYPIEKIFRDARVALIEDGENQILTTRLGLLAQQLYAEGWAQG
ncbi:MAG: acyl-CoA dehydrogenase [Gammaproteobacteria bacterium]|nr:acyl-CoA dehydrogenase [Gammaproteobacteria bacterium]